MASSNKFIHGINFFPLIKISYKAVKASEDLARKVSLERVIGGRGVREAHEGVVSLHYTGVDYGMFLRPTDRAGDHLLSELGVKVGDIKVRAL